MVNVLLILLDLFVACAAMVILFNYIRAFIKRSILVYKLKDIAKTNGWTIRHVRSPYASVFRRSKKPDMMLWTEDCEYIIRLITPVSRKRQYHFLTEEHLVTFTMMFYVLPMASKTSEATIAESYVYLPPLTPLPAPTDKRRVQILLLNPSPVNVTFINDGGTRETAGEQSRIGSWTVCGLSGFFAMLQSPDSH